MRSTNINITEGIFALTHTTPCRFLMDAPNDFVPNSSSCIGTISNRLDQQRR